MSPKRLLVLLLVTYVVLDLTNPFLPGAFQFNADKSVDALSRDCSVTVDVGPISPSPCMPAVEPATESRGPGHLVAVRPAAWTPYLERSRVGGVPVPPADDH